MRCRAFLPLLLALPALAVAQEAAAPAAATCVVAVSALSGEGLAPGNELFLSVLPRLLAAGFSVLPPRFESGDYRAEVATRTASARLYDKGGELAVLLDDLALRRIEPGIDPQERQNKVAAAAAKVLLATEALNLPQAPGNGDGHGDSYGIPMVLYEDNLKGDLLPAAGAYPGSVVKGKKISFLIHGRVKAVGDYVSVEVSVFDTLLARDLASFKTYGDPADPEPLARELGAQLSRFLAGRDFARLSVDVLPASATVAARGQDLYPRDRVFFAFSGGALELEVSAPGYSTATRSIDYRLGESSLVKVELSPDTAGTIQVQTEPSGLPVYLDGIPQGLSPLVATLGSGHSILAASSPDGGAAETIVSPKGPGIITLIPNTDSRTRAKAIASSRDRFYSALGFLVLSLPLTSLAYGLNSMYYDAATRSQDSGLAKAYYLTGVGLGCTAAVSAGFAVNAIIRLVRYVASTE
jgi:hypothetical protein